MNIMNCLGSATVPKSLALQSQGWSFAATLRAGETEQQGWKIESYAATWVIEASASTCGPYWMLLYWMQPQNLRFLICVLRGSMGIWCEWWNPVFLYLGPRTCFFWRPLLIILFCPWHKNRPWKHTPCKIQEDFWVLCSTNLVQTYVCKLNIKLDIYLRTYIYMYQHPPKGWCLNPKGLLDATLYHPIHYFGVAKNPPDARRLASMSSFRPPFGGSQEIGYWQTVTAQSHHFDHFEYRNWEIDSSD